MANIVTLFSFPILFTYFYCNLVFVLFPEIINPKSFSFLLKMFLLLVSFLFYIENYLLIAHG